MGTTASAPVPQPVAPRKPNVVALPTTVIPPARVPPAPAPLPPPVPKRIKQFDFSTKELEPVYAWFKARAQKDGTRNPFAETVAYCRMGLTKDDIARMTTYGLSKKLKEINLPTTEEENWVTMIPAPAPSPAPAPLAPPAPASTPAPAPVVPQVQAQRPKSFMTIPVDVPETTTKPILKSRSSVPAVPQPRVRFETSTADSNNNNDNDDEELLRHKQVAMEYLKSLAVVEPSCWSDDEHAEWKRQLSKQLHQYRSARSQIRMTMDKLNEQYRQRKAFLDQLRPGMASKTFIQDQHEQLETLQVQLDAVNALAHSLPVR